MRTSSATSYIQKDADNGNANSNNNNNDKCDDCRLYFPQTNGSVFSFGRDCNIRWQHGINALPEDEKDGKGRISIILWGLAQNVVEEEGSPPILGSDGKGPHAAANNHRYHNNHRRGRGGHNNNRNYNRKNNNTSGNIHNNGNRK